MKRYNSFVGYYKQKYGERLQKLVLDAGFTCPNRDGKVSTGGCTYCDNAAFHPGYSTAGKSLHQQIDEGISFHKVRYRSTSHYLAYFQAYSNTYGPLEKLQSLYEDALAHPDIVGLVIGTRPDCIDDEKLDYIKEIKERGKIVAVEYGIESCYDETLKHINRGHDFATAKDAVTRTAERGIDTCAHFILGLPGETRDMMISQCDLINDLPLTSVKFHQLQMVRGTVMEKEWEEHPDRFLRLPLDGYLDMAIDILERLRPDLYIERIAGEVPPRFVKETQWGLIRNFEILHLLEARLEERDTWQGRLYQKEK